MARSEAEVQADLTAVRAQMALPGYVAFGDRAVTNRGLADLRQRESELVAELARAQNTPRPRQTLIVASKGF